MGDLRQLYAARIAALFIGRPGDAHAAAEALRNERDAALARLRRTIDEEKHEALEAIPARPGRRYRIAVPALRFWKRSLNRPETAPSGFSTSKARPSV